METRSGGYKAAWKGRKWIILAVLILLIISSAYLFLRFRVLSAKDFVVQSNKKQGPLDLRPALIAKLQQLVKDGSDGLYLLSIGSLDPQITNAVLDAKDVRLEVDSAGLRSLQNKKQVPQDVFRIRFKSLHVEGIGIEDLLHKDRIDIKSITITGPVIENYHTSSVRTSPPSPDRASLYQRLMQYMRHISIGKIAISHGEFVAYAQSKKHADRHFRDVSILLENILIDSTTQNATDRCLFARKLSLESREFSLTSPDSVYEFRIGAVSVSGERHLIIADNVEMKPRQRRQDFEHKLIYRDELLHIMFPRVVLSGVNWWSLLHGEEFIADKAETYHGTFGVYLDKSVPDSPAMDIHNFPSQQLMTVPFPILLKSLNLHDQRITYEEFSPKSGKTGLISFDHMEAVGAHISNIPSAYKANPIAFLNGKGLFMGSVPINCSFRFDLTRHRTGDFKVDVHMGTLDHSVVNTFSEPMALLSFSSGRMVQADAHVSGNNSGAAGTIDCRYDNLHIKVLKEKGNELKKKTLTTFVGNILFVKNRNPGINGSIRRPDFSAVRDHRDNFFSLLWIGIKTGLLKTVGIPIKLGIKDE